MKTTLEKWLWLSISVVILNLFCHSQHYLIAGDTWHQVSDVWVRFESLADELAVGYIVTYVFWLINIYKPEERAKKYYAPIISGSIDDVIWRMSFLLKALQINAGNVTRIEDMTEEQVRNLLSFTPDPNNKRDGQMNYFPNLSRKQFFDLMYGAYNNAAAICDRLLNCFKYMDDELVAAIGAIQIVDIHSGYDDITNKNGGAIPNWPDVVPEIYKRIQELKHLRQVADASLKGYVTQPTDEGK